MMASVDKYYGGSSLANKHAAEKAMRNSLRRRTRNRVTRASARTQVKQAVGAISDGDVQASEQTVAEAIVALDRAASKGVIKKNNAARRKVPLDEKAERGPCDPQIAHAPNLGAHPSDIRSSVTRVRPLFLFPQTLNFASAGPRALTQNTSSLILAAIRTDVLLRPGSVVLSRSRDAWMRWTNTNDFCGISNGTKTGTAERRAIKKYAALRRRQRQCALAEPEPKWRASDLVHLGG